MKTRKTVTIKGITWTILSANERACTVEGHHFFASRCRSSTPWYLREHDCDITASATGARELGYLQFRLETAHLSLAVLDVVRSPLSMKRRDVGQTALIHVTEPASMAYLKRIGAIEGYAAKPADQMPKYVQVAGRGKRLSKGEE